MAPSREFMSLTVRYKHIVIRLLGVEKEIMPKIIEIETLIIRDSRSILI